MTTYTMARTRAGLDNPNALTGPNLPGLAGCITDLPAPEWEGMCAPGTNETGGPVAPKPGSEGLGIISAVRPGANHLGRRDMWLYVWVRAS